MRTGRAPTPPGAAIRRASWWGTGLFALTAAAAVLFPAPGGARAVRLSVVELLAFGVAVVLFAAGCAAFVLAYVRAARRSRTEVIGVGELYLLTGRATPPSARRSLLGALGAQVAVALATAGARPSTSLAAGILVPTYGLGLCGLWAARHGVFPPRPSPRRGRGGEGRS